MELIGKRNTKQNKRPNKNRNTQKKKTNTKKHEIFHNNLTGVNTMYGANNNTGNPYRQDSGFARIQSGFHSAGDNGLSKIYDIAKLVMMDTASGMPEIEESGGTSSFGRS